MEVIFIVNLAVSLVMALGLLLVWRHDPEQRFTHNMAWVTLFNGFSGVAFLLWKSPDPLWHNLGSVLLPASVGFVFANLYAGVAHLGGWWPKRRYAVALWAAFFLTYLVLIERNAHSLLGVINSAAWLVGGLVASRLLWNLGWLARAVGVLVFLGGVNSGFIVLYGADGMAPMYAVGMVLRVALGIVLMSAAMVRTFEKSEQAKERYQVLSHKAAIGIVVLSAERLLYANPAAARIAGYPGVEALLADDVFDLLPQGQRSLCSGQLRRLLSGEQAPLDTVCQVHNKQGQPLHLNISAWRIDWNAQPAVQVVFSDETQKHVAEQLLYTMQQQHEQQRLAFAEASKHALEKANAELEQRVAERTRALEEASQAKSQFLASMSHEIRTPMNVVLGLLQLLLATPQSSVQADYATKAKRAAKSLLGLLNDLLDFSKVDAGKMDLELLPFSVERLLRDLSNMVPTLVGNKPVEVLFDIDPALPDALTGDALRLQQVLLNLLSNAIKFTPRGEVVVQLQVVRRTPLDATLLVSVRDTGIGIALENQRHIFEVFAQAESSITRRFGGSGLGLAICKRLLGLMHSDLQLQSALGTGSRFFFELTLPLADARAVGATLANELEAEADLYVLVVDDNPVARTLTAAMARSLGWRVELAESGNQAVEWVRSLRAAGQALFDVVLVDWKMHPLDGWQTLRAVQDLYPLGSAPALVMASAYGREVLATRAQEDQALLDAFITKPVTASMLHEAVARARHGQGNVRSTPRTPVRKSPRLQGIRVLLVEDNPLNQLVARELLSAEGAQVTTADDGALALAQLAADPQAFDVVLMDMQMPVMDGCTATREIRKLPHFAALPVIAMTANNMQSDKDACHAAGMNAHVGKPFDIGYLVDVIRKHCGLQSPAPGSVQPDLSEGNPAEPAWDVQAAVDAMGGDRALYRQIVQAFSEELTGLPDMLAQQLAADRTAAQRTLHTLKGNAASVGALALAKVAREAELDLVQTRFSDAAADARILSTTEEAIHKAMQQLATLAVAD